MINKILATAVQLYLRSQISQPEDLQVKISGKNRQILQGYIPQVLISCNRGIYQGLHLNQVKIEGSKIGFNLAEVLKKQPFRLLESIIVKIDLKLNTADLQASLASPLLQSGLNDLWQIIVASLPTSNTSIESVKTTVEWQSIAIASEQLNLKGTYLDAKGRISQLNLTTGIKLANNHTLNFSPLEIITDSSSINPLIKPVELNLGTDVTLTQLAIDSGQIQCSGQLTINN